MSDGLLHRAYLHDNVETFDGSGSSAIGCGGGFPCQAGFLILVTSAHSFFACPAGGEPSWRTRGIERSKNCFAEALLQGL